MVNIKHKAVLVATQTIYLTLMRILLGFQTGYTGHQLGIWTMQIMAPLSEQSTDFSMAEP